MSPRIGGKALQLQLTSGGVKDASVPPGDGCAAEDALPAAGASRSRR